MVDPLLVTFVGGRYGPWHVERLQAVVGEPLPSVTRLAMVETPSALPTEGVWHLRGVTSHERYTERRERNLLIAKQPALGRPEATRAALIPIKKKASWWALAQDERRAIFEDQSRHIARGLEVLPAVARRLHHGRDLGEPFDFLTWFEYAPADTSAFEDLVTALRMTDEWGYVEREVDIRLTQ
jgi:Chlorite dismutase